ncbi:uncharacterized protein LOC117640535 isoform X2 [Thrips palmi]|uniref:Uncharacterized protein LOC117640535 isoform X2 n=1 Tax=Thrips palmi TaxID=161013 RepID=A0A6P8Y0G6_THRPL|nr:uncharacterized protein LOC117640535 isoform X2 [Thrips palmi]
MYGRNHHQIAYQPWGGQRAPDHHGKSRDVESELQLDRYRTRLEKEIADLEARKKELLSRFPDPECEKIFRVWGGSDIVDSSETVFCINFLPHFRGKLQGTFTLGVQKRGEVWFLSHHNLPYSISCIAERIAREKIDSIDKLSSFIRCLQQEINLYVWRREQFNEAKELVTPSFGIFPSINTTRVMLAFHVNDSVGSDLSKAYVHLTYKSHKYLPEEPVFRFKGGDKVAQETFKEQLTILECMPLKEAIITAFPRADTSMDSNPGPQMLTEGKEKSIPELSTLANKKRRSTLESKTTSEDENVATPSPAAPEPNPRGRGRGRGTVRGKGAVRGKDAVRGRGRGRGRPPGRRQ